MGIRLNTVHLLAETLRVLGKCSDKKLLTLGVQDCYFSYDEVARFLARHGMPHEPISPAEVLPTTGFKWVPPPEREEFRNCIHQKTLFRLLGFLPENIYSMDVSEFEGADIIHDLNVPVDPSLCSRFDIIFDGGTIEHVFSIKDALFNMCRMCKIGGIVLNFSPVDYINHGFINLNGEILRDCFLANGFEEITLKYIAMPTHPRRINQYYLEFSPDKFRSSLQPYYATGVYSVYRKVEEKPLTVPQQGFYRNLYKLDGHLVPRKVDGLCRRLSRGALHWVDAYFTLSFLIRGHLSIRRGKKVSL